MPQVNNRNFPEYMFAPWFLHTLGDNFGKQKQHEMKELKEMKELSIPRELMHLVLKKFVTAPSYNSLNFLHFALVSMKTENLG